MLEKKKITERVVRHWNKLAMEPQDMFKLLDVASGWCRGDHGAAGLMVVLYDLEGLLHSCKNIL